MTTGSDGGLWRRFEHDPRDPAYAGMRASDRDRAVVHDALAEAYAEGRLDRDELDERTTQADRAKSYGDLLPPLLDLAADAGTGPATVPTADLQRQAAGHYRQELTEAFMGLLVPNLICWAIWFMTGHSSFAWPVFVLIPTVGNVFRVALNRRSIIENRIQKLERKQADALAPTKPPKSARKQE